MVRLTHEKSETLKKVISRVLFWPWQFSPCFDARLDPRNGLGPFLGTQTSKLIKLGGKCVYALRISFQLSASFRDSQKDSKFEVKIGIWGHFGTFYFWARVLGLCAPSPHTLNAQSLPYVHKVEQNRLYSKKPIGIHIVKSNAPRSSPKMPKHSPPPSVDTLASVTLGAKSRPVLK